MKIFKPKFWDQNYFTIFSILLMPFSLIYLIIIYLKKIISNPKNFPIPIICVGNIYIGGTGKTPITLKICKILKELEQDPVIVRKIYTSHDERFLHLQAASVSYRMAFVPASGNVFALQTIADIY